METKSNAMPWRTHSKICTLSQLEENSSSAKAAGKKVVLCHGVFDLLHMGHVKHLQAARREGDLLIVTITADDFVNKGPGRPVFSQQLRAEMLASMECIDFVGINDAQTAEGVLNAIKPNFYAKGSDYKSSSDDITGNILNEKQIVEQHGGKLIYTDEITFSSSTLINQYMSIYEPTLQQYLDERRNEKFLDQLLLALESLKGMRILFIGDAIIDEYQYVVPMGRSAKENMIATLYQDREVFAGGVFAAANHVAEFCDHVEVITSFGSYDSYEDLARSSLKENITLHPIYRKDAPTTRKCRFIDTGYSMRKLFEVYFMDDRPLSEDNESNLIKLIEERMAEADVVVVTDFGHGLLNKNTIELLKERAPFLAVNAQSNSANHGFNLISKYDRSDYICIDGPEARLAVHDKYASLETILQDSLPKQIDCSKMVITQGKNGCLVFDSKNGLSKVPALTSTIVDTVGAGDAFFALTAPLVASGLPMEQIGFLGNAAGAIKVGIVGHRTSVQKVPLIKFLTALLK